jgi:pyridoxine 4-dehydrogenase
MGTTLRLGDTEVVRMGLGTNRLANTADNRAFIAQVAAAGIGVIDTAHLYAGGESEATIGAALGQAPDRPMVATKGGFGGAGRGRPDVLRAEIEESLRRLQTDAIELYYLHQVDPETPIEESLGAIAEYRDAGKIRHVAVSNVSVEEVERARAIVPIAAVQNHYSLTKRDSDDVVDYCAEQEVVFVPYFPLRGVQSRVLAEIAERRRATESQIALAWLLRRSPTTLPIPGTLSIEHLRENLGALEIELNDEEYEALA